MAKGRWRQEEKLVLQLLTVEKEPRLAVLNFPLDTDAAALVIRLDLLSPATGICRQGRSYQGLLPPSCDILICTVRVFSG